jgi:hypothetical protein
LAKEAAGVSGYENTTGYENTRPHTQRKAKLSTEIDRFNSLTLAQFNDIISA